MIKQESLIKENLDIPPEIVNAAKEGSLVVFVGSGISRLVGSPLWDGFANTVVDQISPEAINYDEARRLKEIKDPRRRLSLAIIIAKEKKVSINYEKILHPKEVKEGSIYDILNNLNCTYITTNYDRHLHRNKPKPTIDSGDKKADETDVDLNGEWRIYELDDLLPPILEVTKKGEKGKVVHLHGFIDNPDKMVITTRDYLNHYSKEKVKTLLKYLFTNKSVLFIGYSLEEVEILEYILKNSQGIRESSMKRLFILQGFYSSDEMICATLKKYYFETFGVELLPFLLDKNEYFQQENILKDWGDKLVFEPVGISDELSKMMDEISG